MRAVCPFNSMFLQGPIFFCRRRGGGDREGIAQQAWDKHSSLAVCQGAAAAATGIYRIRTVESLAILRVFGPVYDQIRAACSFGACSSTV